MKLSLGKLALAGLFVVAAPFSASAQFMVSCAPGMAPVPSTDGVEIVGGLIQLLGEACRTTGGTALPSPLQVSNQSVLPNPVVAGNNVTYSAALANLLPQQPEPEQNYDRCDVVLRNPNDQVVSSGQVTNLGAMISVPVTIPSNGAAGTWKMALVCRRFISGQEIILPVAPPVAFTVNSNVIPTGCDNLEAPFVSGTVSTYQSKFGVDFGGYHSWLSDATGGNTYANGVLQSIKVRSYSFNAPQAGKSGDLKLPSTLPGIAYSISSQCGDFNVPAACQAVNNGNPVWSTKPGAPNGHCKLIPGQPYYLNVAWFDYHTYLQNGSVVSTCVSPSPTGVCNTSYHHRSTPHN
jgi:hypothetical protein